MAGRCSRPFHYFSFFLSLMSAAAQPAGLSCAACQYPGRSAKLDHNCKQKGNYYGF